MISTIPNDAHDFFEDVKAYVAFGPAQAAVLRELVAVLEPHFAVITEKFYARILAHPGAHASITGGGTQVARLKQTLVEWIESGLRGPHDRGFYERRARIGRKHVEIGLPQPTAVAA